MGIDVLFLLVLVMAIFKGWRQGLIMAIFSTVAIIIGLAAAIKLSTVVAGYGTTEMHLHSRWWPVLAFLLVFLGTVILVRWGGRLLSEMMDLAMIGWLNRLAGILLYAILYTIIVSVLLFYAVQVHIIPDRTLSSSVTYPFIRPWGPVVIDEFGKFVPWFKGMFTQLEDFFGHLRNRL